MVRFYDSISKDHQEWALRQDLFFIATAPLVGKHVNLSPKGQPSATLTILDGNHVGYLDATGSGIETVSHIYENGRATMMFCSFAASPRIMRWYCQGRVIEVDHPEYFHWLAKMAKKEYPSMRAIILLEVFKVATSCGFAVPLLSQRIDPGKEDRGPVGCFAERKTLENFATKSMGYPVEMTAFRVKMNSRSLDGCPGLRAARNIGGKRFLLLQDVRSWLSRTLSQWEAMLLGAIVAIVIVETLRVIVAKSWLYVS